MLKAKQGCTGYGYLAGVLIRIGERVPGTNKTLVEIVRRRKGDSNSRQIAVVQCMRCKALRRKTWSLPDIKKRCLSCKINRSNWKTGDRLRMSEGWVRNLRRRGVTLREMERLAREWNARGKSPWFNCKYMIDGIPAVRVAREHGIDRRRLYDRLEKGEDLLSAATRTVRRYRTSDGRLAARVAAEHGISRQLMSKRARAGMDIEEAATRTPHA